MLNLYQEILMDHYRAPHNQGLLDCYDFCAEQRNSSCGDEVVMTGKVSENELIALGWVGKGCVISQSAASILSEYIKNKSLEDISALDKDDLIAMLGMQLGPVRLLCGLLPLMALQKGIGEYRARQ